jgi:lysine/ornithine N-monooxygenase
MSAGYSEETKALLKELRDLLGDDENDPVVSREYCLKQARDMLHQAEEVLAEDMGSSRDYLKLAQEWRELALAAVSW